jgi:hypothetical protein
VSAIDWTAITQAAASPDGAAYLAEQLAAAKRERDGYRERLTQAHREQQEARTCGFGDLAASLRAEVAVLEGRAAHWSAAASRIARVIAEAGKGCAA